VQLAVETIIGRESLRGIQVLLPIRPCLTRGTVIKVL